MKTPQPREYKGVWLELTYSRIHGFRWWQAFMGDRFLYADTLAGIKELVTEYLRKEAKS